MLLLNNIGCRWCYCCYLIHFKRVCVNIKLKTLIHSFFFFLYFWFDFYSIIFRIVRRLTWVDEFSRRCYKFTHTHTYMKCYLFKLRDEYKIVNYYLVKPVFIFVSMLLWFKYLSIGNGNRLLGLLLKFVIIFLLLFSIKKLNFITIGNK